MGTQKFNSNIDVDGEVKGDSLDIDGNADISGNLTSSTSSTIGTPKIIMQADGTLDWGAAKDYGTLTWDTGYALIDGQSGKGIKFRTNGSSLALTLDTSQNATFAGNVVPAGITLDGNTVTGIDDSGEFTDDDAHIMTSAAINDKFATYNWVNSRGENLFSNGSGLLGDITNMPGFTFDGSNANNSPGSFKWTGTGTPNTSEFIPVDASRKYKMQYDAKTENGVGRYYGFTSCFDVDGIAINSHNHMYRANTLTTLAVQLVNGATTITLTDSANWNNAGTAGSSNHLRSLIIWNYANSFGYTYPEETYSRNYTSQAWDPGDINFTSHVITLRVAWAGGTIAAGTKVSNGSAGGTYKYNVMSSKLLTTDWVRQEGYMDGIDYTGTNNTSKFPPGTAKIKLGWLMNYQNLQAGEVAWFTNINVGVAAHEDDEIAEAVERATDSNTFTDADHTKLNAIEASADVTDATNVTAAGALMDSEVTNLAAVKAFATTDYATAAQGSTAESALQSLSGAVLTTGNQTIAGTKTFSGNISANAATVVGIVMDSNTITGIDDSGNFTNNNNHIMTSAAIEDKILGYGYTTYAGPSDGAEGTKGIVEIANEEEAIAGEEGLVKAVTPYGVSLAFSGKKVTELTAPTSAFAMNSQKITGLATPAASTDAANKTYVDAKEWNWNDITAGTPPTFNQNTTGSAGTLTTTRAIYGNNFDGSAAVTGTIATAYIADDAITEDKLANTLLAEIDANTTKNTSPNIHGEYIKITLADFAMGGYTGNTKFGVAFDKTAGSTTYGVRVPDSAAELYTFVNIPQGYKATHVEIYGKRTKVVEAFEVQINASTAVSKGTGNCNTEFAITNVDSTATNLLMIEVVVTSNSADRVYGGRVKIAAI